MKKKTGSLSRSIVIAILAVTTPVIFLATSCSKKENNPISEYVPVPGNAGAPTSNVPKNDTILNVTYESGQLNSGIDDLGLTTATAPDADYIVNPARNGSNYAVAHKIIYGDAGYYSDGAYRSESDALAIKYRFFPGEERRYEFSTLLKDWTPWDASKEIYESNFYQLKVSGNSTGSGVPLQIRATRNSIRLRYALSTGFGTKDILADVRPYVNQWIHFRIDVLWSDGNTGYMKTYMKLPGQSDYVKVDERLNYKTFDGNVSIGNVGYIKWGLYASNQGLTRIAYHDDIRIIKLPLVN